MGKVHILWRLAPVFGVLLVLPELWNLLITFWILDFEPLSSHSGLSKEPFRAGGASWLWTDPHKKNPVFALNFCF